jgi:hypothetical protein
LLCAARSLDTMPGLAMFGEHLFWARPGRAARGPARRGRYRRLDPVTQT